MQEGHPAHSFTAIDQDGAPVRLADFAGRPLVLYFYPRASTPGCTIEAREFREAYPEFQKLGVAVVGVSPDKAKAQKKFRENECLPFPLLADENRELATAFDVLREKNLYGLKYIGVERTTVLIGPDGVVRQVLRKVKPKGHAQQVLQALRTLGLVPPA